MIEDHKGYFARKFINKLKRRLSHQNSNFMVLITGRPGTGKSYYSLSLAKLIDPNFDIYSKMYYDSVQMIKDVRDGKIKKKDVVVLEESGVDLNARSAMTTKNSTIQAVLQTVRFLNWGLILNLPNIGMIDRNVRKLLHYHFSMTKIDRTKKRGIAKIASIEEDEFTGKKYFPFPKFKMNGLDYKMKYMGLPQPDKLMLDAYESRKLEFSQEFYTKALDKIETVEENKKKKSKSNKLSDDQFDKCLETIKDNPDKFRRSKNGVKFDRDIIVSYFELPYKEATRLKRTAELKLFENK